MDNENADTRRPSSNPGGDKGRKRTSTKEAPVDFQQDASSNGKSAAPLNKKAKTDSRTPQGGKASY